MELRVVDDRDVTGVSTGAADDRGPDGRGVTDDAMLPSEMPGAPALKHEKLQN